MMFMIDGTRRARAMDANMLVNVDDAWTMGYMRSLNIHYYQAIRGASKLHQRGCVWAGDYTSVVH